DTATGKYAPDYYVNPCDRRHIVDLARQHGSVRDIEVQMNRPSGETFWALVSATAMDYDGEPSIFLALNDITELKTREAQLVEANATKDAALHDLQAVLDTIDYGILFLDDELRVRLTNRAYREIWDMPAEFFAGNPTLLEDMEHTRRQGLYALSEEQWEEY